MAIYRTKSKRNYTHLSNSTLQDSALSMEALGLLVYLLSLPEDWVIQMTQIEAHFHIGKDKRKRVVSELEKRGYLKVKEIRGDKGKFAGVDYDLFEEPPEVSPEAGLPSTGFPAPVNPPLQINKNNKELKITKNPLPPAGAGPQNEKAISKPSRERKRTAIPEDWLPSKQAAAFAIEQGMSPEDFKDEIRKFRNYWLEANEKGTRGLKADWNRTFENWCLNWKKYRREQGGRAFKDSKAGAFSKAAERAAKVAEAYDAEGEVLDQVPNLEQGGILDLEAIEVRAGSKDKTKYGRGGKARDDAQQLLPL